MAKSKNINIKWTLEEESFLINNYSNKSWDYILNQLPRHNKKQIIDKASYMKIKRERVWSFEDITILKKIYEKSLTHSILSYAFDIFLSSIVVLPRRDDIELSSSRLSCAGPFRSLSASYL